MCFQKKLKKIVGCLFALCSLSVSAQNVTVEASIDSLQILIGEQTKVKLEVSFDAHQKLTLPVVRDTLVRGVEVVDIAKPDTQYLNNKQRLLVTQEYIVTSFDSAFYYIPPFTVGVIGSFIWLSLFIIPLVILVIYLIIRYKDNKPIIRTIKLEPKLPPHQQAMKEFERIKSEKSWQHGDSKEYYTELTDTIRVYIKERFGFNALEMTSAEIIDHLLQENDQKAIDELKTLFNTADLVKFAKHNPLMNENDMNLVNAIEFINQTKIEADPNAKPVPAEITIEEKRSRRAKIILLSFIVVLSVAVVTMLVFVIRDIYNLCF